MAALLIVGDNALGIFAVEADPAIVDDLVHRPKALLSGVWSERQEAFKYALLCDDVLLIVVEV